MIVRQTKQPWRWAEDTHEQVAVPSDHMVGMQGLKARIGT